MNGSVTDIHHDGERTIDASDNKVHIFISHKLDEKKVAEDIQNNLLKLGAGRMDIFLSEDIEFGEQWYDQIHQAIDRTDWFILLYTDPTLEWDWCLYEAGYFSAKKHSLSEGRLICLTAGEESEVPGPIANWKPVPANEEAINKLLRQIYFDSPRDNVTPVFGKKEAQIATDQGWLSDCAQRIAAVLNPSPKKVCYSRFFQLVLNQQQINAFNDSKELPETAMIDGEFLPDDSAFILFGLNPGVLNWSEFSEHIIEKQGGWIHDLNKQLELILSEKPPDKLALPAFRSAFGDYYCPVIHRSRVDRGSLKLWILFVPTPYPADEEVTHPHPCIKLRFSQNGGNIIEATRAAESIYGVEKLKDTSLEAMVGILKEKMSDTQRAAFDDEQDLLIGRLLANKRNINAEVCMVFKESPEKAYLPLITKFFTNRGENYIDVVYLDVSKQAVEENGVIKCKLNAGY